MKKNYVFDSYFRIRFALGVLGIALPVILIIGTFCLTGGKFLNSISDYYNSTLNPFFVGILFILALFLYAYRGSGLGHENLITNIASIAALLTALLPCKELLHPDLGFEKMSRVTSTFVYYIWEDRTLIGHLHLVAAASLLALFGYLSFVVFPSNKSITSGQRKYAMVVGIPFPILAYRFLGILIWCSIVVCGLYIWLKDQKVIQEFSWPIVFVFESVALFAFGLSWIAKSLFLLTDRDTYEAYKRGTTYHE